MKQLKTKETLMEIELKMAPNTIYVGYGVDDNFVEYSGIIQSRDTQIGTFKAVRIKMANIQDIIQNDSHPQLILNNSSPITIT